MNDSADETEDSAPELLAVEIGKAIREIRGVRNLGLTDFKGKISQTLMSDIENGKRSPSMQFIRKFSDAIGINPYYIFLLAAKARGSIDPLLHLILEEAEARVRSLMSAPADDLAWYPGTVKLFVPDLGVSGVYGVLFRDRDFALVFPHEILDARTIELKPGDRILVPAGKSHVHGRFQGEEASSSKTRKNADAVNYANRKIKVVLDAPLEGMNVEIALQDVGLIRQRSENDDAAVWSPEDFVYARFPEGRNIESRLLSVSRKRPEPTADPIPLGDDSRSFTLGAVVQCRWNGGSKYYQGKITEIDGNRIHIDYDDGDKEWTTADMIQK